MERRYLMFGSVLDAIIVRDIYDVLYVIEQFLSLKTERERMRFAFGGK